MAISEAAFRIVSSNMKQKPKKFPKFKENQKIEDTPVDILYFLDAVKCEQTYLSQINFFSYLAELLYENRKDSKTSYLILTKFLEHIPQQRHPLNTIIEG